MTCAKILEEIGSEVTNLKQFTVGRWYALEVGRERTMVHAECIKHGNTVAFRVSDDDLEAHRAHRINQHIYRDVIPYLGRRAYKFKQVVPVLPQALPDGRTTVDLNLKVGDRFELVKPRGGYPLGTVFELALDDKSSSPFFHRVGDDGKAITAYRTRICLYKLAKLELVPPPEPVPEPVTVSAPTHPVDAIKQQIDILVARADLNRAESEKLLTMAQNADDEADKLRAQLAAELRGYLPTQKPQRLF